MLAAMYLFWNKFKKQDSLKRLLETPFKINIMEQYYGPL